MSYRPNFETHAEGMRTSLARLVDLAERADQRDVLNNQALLNNTGKTNEALVAIGELIERLLASSALIQAFTAGTEDNTEAIAKTLQAAGGQNAILENMMDDLRPLAVEAGGAGKFGQCELVGVVSMGQAEARARRYTREEADAMRLRKDLSNAYDQLAQANDRCNEIAAERDEANSYAKKRDEMINILQDNLNESRREVRSLTTDLDLAGRTADNNAATIKKQQDEIACFELFMHQRGWAGWHGQFLQWKANQPKPIDNK